MTSKFKFPELSIALILAMDPVFEIITIKVSCYRVHVRTVLARSRNLYPWSQASVHFQLRLQQLKSEKKTWVLINSLVCIESRFLIVIFFHIDGRDRFLTPPNLGLSDWRVM
jgi:hypothetical protein